MCCACTCYDAHSSPLCRLLHFSAPETRCGLEGGGMGAAIVVNMINC